MKSCFNQNGLPRNAIAPLVWPIKGGASISNATANRVVWCVIHMRNLHGSNCIVNVALDVNRA